MKLADLKKVAIRKHSRIRFAVPGGLECVVNEHGVAQVPGLSQAPDFSLEDALRSAVRFTLEPAPAAKKKPSPAQQLTAGQLAALTAGNPETPHHDDHDE
jgi:hypothetical protein